MWKKTNLNLALMSFIWAFLEVIKLICWMFLLTESQTDRAGRAQSWRGEGHSVAGRGRQRYSGWKQSWISHDWLLCKSEFTTQMCVPELIWNGLLFVCVRSCRRKKEKQSWPKTEGKMPSGPNFSVWRTASQKQKETEKVWVLDTVIQSWAYVI